MHYYLNIYMRYSHLALLTWYFKNNYFIKKYFENTTYILWILKIIIVSYFYRLLQNFRQLIPNSTSLYTLLINKIYINQTPTSSPLETPWKFAGRVYTYSSKHTCNTRRIVAGGFQGDLICKVKSLDILIIE